MTPDAVFDLAAEHLDHEAAIIATAIAWAESDLDPEAVGDQNLQDSVWGPSIGLFQIRSLRAHTGTGKERDANRLRDPEFNTRAMAIISKSGTDWTPWSVYKNGRYRQYLDPVRAAVGKGGTPMQLVTRDDWGARSPRSATGAPGMTRGVGVHWLGPGAGRSTHSQCASHMREVQAFHMGPSRGWADFAYNAAACSHGYVFEGRGRKVRNAANGGGTRNGLDANAAWASVLYLAGIDGPGLTPAGMDAINDAADWLGVADGEWLGHRDFLNTECPGNEIYRWVHSGHPRGSGAPTPPKPSIEGEPMVVHLVCDGEDWLFDSPGRIMYRITSPIWDVLKACDVPRVEVERSVLTEFQNVAKNAGFTG